MENKRDHGLVRNIILVLICAIGIFVIAIYMCLPANSGKVVAKNGIYDLSEAGNLEKSIYSLNGQWEFYYGQLISPGEFENYSSEKQYIQVPNPWNEQGYPKKGFATYRLRITTKQEEHLTLYKPSFAEAATIWINGKKMYEKGVVGKSEEESKEGSIRSFITFDTTDCQAEIVVWICNYHYYYNGISFPVKLSAGDLVMRDFLIRVTLYTMLLGALFIMGLYHIILYFHQREKQYLYFSLVCFFGLLRFYTETGGISSYLGFFHHLAWETDLYFTSYFLYLYYIVCFTIVLSKSKLLEKVIFRYHIIPIFTTLLSVLIPKTEVQFLILILLVLGTGSLIFGAVMLWRSQERKKNGYVKLYFFTYLFYIITNFIFKILFDQTVFMLTLTAFFLLMIVQSIVLSLNYANAFRQVEITNQNLERIVEERTAQLYAANEQLTISKNAITEMISNISHDLKMPLTVLSVHLEMLMDDKLDLREKEKESYLQIAYNKNLALQRLIHNLFEVTRIETGRLSFQLELVDINILLSQVNQKYAEYIQNTGLDFRAVCEERFSVRIDQDKIWSIFDNIIYNAMRYTKTGSIKVTARKLPEGKLAEIRITDTGCGIAAEHLPHLFDRFYKASQARNDKNSDGGIGLYIVKCNVEGMGGTVWAESVVGKGTSILFTLCSE